MAAEQQVLEKIRASVRLQLGSKVQILQEEGRNRAYVCEGILQNAYPCVFTVLITGKDREDEKLLSFNYSDIVTKSVRMKLCKESA
ncbi:Uncharacterized protein Veg [Lachnospiraceae bacterium XBB1006]|nr:Uncharacterized protein Veg [Lachnospiraceae bacterium XBB1006]